MKSHLFLLSLALSSALASTASAACFADYKAKRENPLRLHYGVMRIDTAPCRMSDTVKRDVAQRLAEADWQLLGVQSVFDDSGLEQRKTDAGEYYLRF